MNAGFGRPIVGIRRIVAQRGILDQEPDDIDAKSIDAAVEPEAQHVIHCGAHVRIVPVKIGLLGQKAVQGVLAGPSFARPGRSAKLRQPVIGRRSIGLAVAPDVPVALRIDARRAAFEKPRMTFGGVVGNEIEDDFDFSYVRRVHKSVEIFQRSEQGIDVAVVADVISEVRHRRWIDRRYPDRIDAKPFEIVEAFAYSLQITDTIAIRVLKGARIDLIDDAVLPPDKFGHERSSRISRRRYPVQLAALYFSSLTANAPDGR